MKPAKKKRKKAAPVDTSGDRIGCLFMDSGAHSLWNIYVGNKTLGRGYEKYDSKDFWSYVDKYAAWVKEQGDAVDYYANVDVIYDPERSWKVLKYLENEHGLHPVPVIHHGADVSWVDKHLDAGYEFIGIGGLGQGVTLDGYYDWADQVFARICPGPTYMPLARTHGFAMTSYELMLRYCWWSVDSASWVKAGGFGMVMVPHKRGGKFVFDEKPYTVTISNESPAMKNGDAKHFQALNRWEKAVVAEWLAHIGIDLERAKSHHAERKIANLKFFQALCESLPPWPWPFRPKPTAGKLVCETYGSKK